MKGKCRMHWAIMRYYIRSFWLQTFFAARKRREKKLQEIISLAELEN